MLVVDVPPARSDARERNEFCLPSIPIDAARSGTQESRIGISQVAKVTGSAAAGPRLAGGFRGVASR
jgi:hypothetical protein